MKKLDVQKIRDLHSNGKSMRSIAKEFDVSPTTISNKLKKANEEKPIRRTPKSSMMGNIGSTGLKGMPAANHEDFLRAFKGQQMYRTIQEMINNEPVIAASSFCIKKLIKQTNMTIDAGSDSPEDVAAAEFVTECIDDMSQSWSHFLEECLSFIDYGFSAHEINYKVRRGMQRKRPSERSNYNDLRIGWRGFPVRAQATIEDWTYDRAPNGYEELSGCYQNNSGVTLRWQNPQKVWIPIEKLLLFRTGVYKDNPQGQSIFRKAYIPYFYKKELQRIQAIGYERSFNGLPVMYAPIDIMTDDANADQQALYSLLKNIVSNVRADEQAGIIMPSEYDDGNNKLYDFQLLSSGNQVDEGMEVSIRRYTLEMLMTTLTDLILLGHGENGSFALANSKTSMFAIAASNYMREIEEIFNRHAIPRLLELNKIQYSKLPRMNFDEIEIADIEVISMMVKNLADAGMDLSDVEDNLRQRMLIPKKTTSTPMLPKREESQMNKPEPQEDDKQDEQV